jgi:hypothetical protein
VVRGVIKEAEVVREAILTNARGLVRQQAAVVAEHVRLSQTYLHQVGLLDRRASTLRTHADALRAEYDRVRAMADGVHWSFALRPYSSLRKVFEVTGGSIEGVRRRIRVQPGRHSSWAFQSSRKRQRSDFRMLAGEGVSARRFLDGLAVEVEAGEGR